MLMDNEVDQWMSLNPGTDPTIIVRQACPLNKSSVEKKGCV